jgi:hypothetical protein
MPHHHDGGLALDAVGEHLIHAIDVQELFFQRHGNGQLDILGAGAGLVGHHGDHAGVEGGEGVIGQAAHGHEAAEEKHHHQHIHQHRPANEKFQQQLQLSPPGSARCASAVCRR